MARTDDLFGGRVGGTDRSFSGSLPPSYFNMYRRPENDPARRDWFRRANYPPPAFGLGHGYGYGFDNRHGGGKRYHRGPSHGRWFHDRYPRWSSFGLGYHVGRRHARYYDYSCNRPRTSWGIYIGAGYNWRSYCRSYYRPVCNPWYGTTYVSTYPWYVSDWGGDTTYVTNNYFDDGYADPAYVPGSVDDSLVPTVLPDSQSSIVQPPAPSTSHADLALQAFAQGDYAVARREFVRAMLAYPEDPELIMLYGYAHFATGDYLVAALAIRRATEADPTLIEQPIDIHQLYPDAAAFQSHLDRLDMHVSADEHDIDARFLAGFVRYAAGMPDAAGTYFTECSAKAPDDSLYFIMRDAALRASVLQAGAERAADDAQD